MDRIQRGLSDAQHKCQEAKLENEQLRTSLHEARKNGDRLHKESEHVVSNVNTWVQEQK